MKRGLWMLLFVSCALTSCGLSSTPPASPEQEPLTYQFEKQNISLEKGISILNRAYGSWAVNTASGQILLERMRWRSEWMRSHDDVTILWGVPFLWPKNTPVAYEYWLQCGNKICWSLYDIFPGQKNLSEIGTLFADTFECTEKYLCNWWINNPIGGDTSAYTFFIPDVTPSGIRIAQFFPKGIIRFYHGIYGVSEAGEVISLDTDDRDITMSEIIGRQRDLINIGTADYTNRLLDTRARTRHSPHVKTKEALSSVRNTERPYACKKNAAWQCPFNIAPLLIGSYRLINNTIDVITGRIYQLDPAYIPTYRDYPL